MIGLFAQVYLDEDVSIIVASKLRSRHFIANTTVKARNRDCSDEQQLSCAASINSVLMTHNRVRSDQLATAYANNNLAHPELSSPCGGQSLKW